MYCIHLRTLSILHLFLLTSFYLVHIFVIDIFLFYRHICTFQISRKMYNVYRTNKNDDHWSGLTSFPLIEKMKRQDLRVILFIHQAHGMYHTRVNNVRHILKRIICMENSYLYTKFDGQCESIRIEFNPQRVMYKYGLMRFHSFNLSYAWRV